MDLKGIINISGKSGLFKIISEGKNLLVVESLVDGKKSPLHSSNQATLLEEIGIYTYEDTKPLQDIFNIIAKKEDGKQTISHKSSKNELEKYFREILNDYDEDRVYTSDIKRIFQWYNIIHKKGLIQEENKKKNK